MAIGFGLRVEVERLPIPVEQPSGDSFITRVRLTATPQRGKALRRHSKDGQLVGERLSNMPLEIFNGERVMGASRFHDLYAERCAADMLEAITVPA